MADLIQKRRRWPYGVAALLLLGGVALWLYRPLNSVERRVVGEWVSTESPRTPWTFRSDRTFDWLHASGQSVRGTWSCTSSSIELLYDPPKIRTRWERIQERFSSLWHGWDRHTLAFTAGGNLLIGSTEYVRVTEPAARPAAKEETAP